MSQQRYYIKADFTANYSGKKLEKGTDFHKRTYQTAFSNVVLENIEPQEFFLKNELRLGNDFIDDLNLNDVLIKLPTKADGQETFVKTNIREGILRNPVITESGKIGNTTLGKVKGTLYAVVERKLPDAPVTSTTEYKQKSIAYSPTPATKVGNSKTTVLSGSGNNWWNTNWLSGCFSNLLWILLGLFLLSLLIHGLPWIASLLKILLILFGIYLLFAFLGKLLRALSGIFAFILAFIFILSLLSYLFSHTNWQEQDSNRRKIVQEDDKTEQSNLQKDSSLVNKDNADCNDNPLLAIHHRKWIDFIPANYEGNLMMSQCNYIASRQNREGFNPQGYNPIEQFNQVYATLANNDKNKMQLIYHLFDSLRTANKLTDSKFADLIVTCVQDIPYRLVIDDASELDGRMLQLYREQGALEHIKFGVQSPAEFMYNLEGDCDTRALFCFTVLDHYGYDAAILISDYYSHAILGLSLPTTGNYLAFNGRRYYTWETTAKGFQLGQMAPDCGNMNYWDVILTNN